MIYVQKGSKASTSKPASTFSQNEADVCKESDVIRDVRTKKDPVSWTERLYLVRLTTLSQKGIFVLRLQVVFIEAQN